VSAIIDSSSAQEGIIKTISAIATGGPIPPAMATAVRDLAEAYAWLAFPAQPHGGSAAAK
jgi:hypothetical protein